MLLFNTCTLLVTISSLLLPAAAKDFKRFSLKTEVIGHFTQFDGLYVIPAHTFAGGQAPGLFPLHAAHHSYATTAFLNETTSRVYFTYNGHQTKSPYERLGLDFLLVDVTAAWGYMTANSGSKGSSGFAIDKAGYLVNTKYREPHNGDFTWKACQWWHGYPELFWNNQLVYDNEHPNLVPSSCSNVRLKVVEPVKGLGNKG